MELYFVKQAGFANPLSSGEISHLFRVGHLHRRVRCKPLGDENWRTVGEMFPLLDYANRGYSLPSDVAKSGRRLTLTFALAVALIATGTFLYGNRSAARDTNYARSVAQPRNHAAVAATTARVFLLYSRLAYDSTEVRAAAPPRPPRAAARVVLARND